MTINFKNLVTINNQARESKATSKRISTLSKEIASGNYEHFDALLSAVKNERIQCTSLINQYYQEIEMPVDEKLLKYETLSEILYRKMNRQVSYINYKAIYKKLLGIKKEIRLHVSALDKYISNQLKSKGVLKIMNNKTIYARFKKSLKYRDLTQNMYSSYNDTTNRFKSPSDVSETHQKMLDKLDQIMMRYSLYDIVDIENFEVLEKELKRLYEAFCFYKDGTLYELPKDMQTHNIKNTFMNEYAIANFKILLKELKVYRDEKDYLEEIARRSLCIDQILLQHPKAFSKKIQNMFDAFEADNYLKNKEDFEKMNQHYEELSTTLLLFGLYCYPYVSNEHHYKMDSQKQYFKLMLILQTIILSETFKIKWSQTIIEIHYKWKNDDESKCEIITEYELHKALEYIEKTKGIECLKYEKMLNYLAYCFYLNGTNKSTIGKFILDKIK